MNLDTFFKKFDQFADAPDAVAKMRELVLELASKGALSERRASDQTDSAWRKFTSEFDSRGGRLEPGSSLPFELPDTWRWVTLDDVGTTKIRNDVDDDTLVSFVPMALISAKYGVPAQSEERLWREVKKGFTHFAEGDVVMAKITPCFENAKSAVMRNLVNGAGAGTTELLVFRGDTKIILPEFVLIYLKTRGFISRGEPRMTGSAGQKRVPREYFAGSPFPLPPLAEQKRIVAKVAELMALCDRLEVQQQERDEQASALARASLARFAEAPNPANLNLLFHKSFVIAPDEIRMAVLTLAIRGLLVRQIESEGDARAHMENSSSRNVAGSWELPSKWIWAPVNETGRVDLGRQRAPQHHLGPNMRPYLRVQNVYEGRIDVSDVKTMNFTPAEFQTFALASGDILLNEGQSYKLVGRPAIYRGEVPGACFQNTLVRYRCRNFVLPEYALMVFRAYMRNGTFQRISKQTTNIAHLSAGRFAVLEFPLPPLAEQRRIVAKVDQLMALVDQLEMQLADSRAAAKNLLEAVVAELTGNAEGQKVSARSASSTGCPGRPRKSA